jgi:hypothetical protein
MCRFLIFLSYPQLGFYPQAKASMFSVSSTCCLTSRCARAVPLPHVIERAWGCGFWWRIADLLVVILWSCALRAWR